MSLLAPVGTCSYNGVDLNPAECETLGISHNPISDPAGRTVSYVQSVIRIKTVIYTTPPTTTDATIDAIVPLLSEYAGAFKYDTKGGGTIHANVPGERTKDVMFGPKPRVIQLTPKGPYAWDLVWEVVVCLPQCEANTYENALMEINFGLTFSNDESSYTQRHYKGHLRIPSTRLAGNPRGIKYTADDFRAKIWPIPIPGFRRQHSDFTISDDHMRLDFSITDVEMPPNVPPAGIVKVEADHSHTHSMGQGSGFGIGMWQGTLNATYELQKGTPPVVAFNHFIALLNDRRAAILNSAAVAGSKSSSGNAIGALILTGLSCSEPQIFGKTLCRFSASYTVTSQLSAFLTAGMWRQSPGSNWATWAGSMAWGGKNKPERGIAQLAFRNVDDRIEDLCDVQADQPIIKSPGGGGAAGRPIWVPGGAGGNGLIGQALDLLAVALQSVKNPLPNPAGTWLYWRNSLFLETKDGTIAHQPLIPSGSLLNQLTLAGEGKNVKNMKISDPFVGTDGYSPETGLIVVPPNLIQQRTADTCHVIMEGEAIRVGFEIDPPVLQAIDGTPCVPANQKGDGVKQAKIWDFFGLPVYHCIWRKRYLMEKTPKNVSVAPHPFLDQDQLNVLRTGGIFPV